MAQQWKVGTGEPEEPRLKVAATTAREQLVDRISVGRELSTQSRPLSDLDALKAREQEMYSWTEYNRSLLRRLFDGPILEEYRPPISFGGAAAPQARLREFEEDLAGYIRKLESIVNRLPLWDESLGMALSAPLSSRPRELVLSDGAIFVVHGQDTRHKLEVARVLDKVTERDVVILHEQPKRGRTILEQFEHHAERAAFAVVLLTADDEGQQKGGSSLNPRGRQNVIFELGFFFAKLGRENVMVLMDAGVEQPSDMTGLIYEILDAAGAWKQRLAKELDAAGIEVDYRAIP
jgi:hypothetical protein